jgi:alpha-L-rhamnosidase
MKMKKSRKVEDRFFLSAKPVWLKGIEKEMNIFAGFRAVFEAPSDAKIFLRIAASSLYRGWLNGEFLCHGPARGPHGFYRVDEWDLTGKIVKGKNLIAFEAAG